MLHEFGLACHAAIGQFLLVSWPLIAVGLDEFILLAGAAVPELQPPSLGHDHVVVPHGRPAALLIRAIVDGFFLALAMPSQAFGVDVILERRVPRFRKAVQLQQGPMLQPGRHAIAAGFEVAFAFSNARLLRQWVVVDHCILDGAEFEALHQIQRDGGLGGVNQVVGLHNLYYQFK